MQSIKLTSKEGHESVIPVEKLPIMPEWKGEEIEKVELLNFPTPTK